MKNDEYLHTMGTEELLRMVGIATEDDVFSVLHDLSFPSAQRNCLFCLDVTASAFFYLSNNFDKRRLPDEEFRKAFLYGYICALHKSHTFNQALLLHDDKLIKQVTDDVHRARAKFRSFPAYLFLTGLNPGANNLPKAFLEGYQAAFICNNRYDRSLFMSGHELHVEALSSMIAYRKSEENARRAAARVVMQHSIQQQDKLRTRQGSSSTDESTPKVDSTTMQNRLITLTEQYKAEIERFYAQTSKHQHLDDDGNRTISGENQEIPERFATGVASDTPVGHVLYVDPEIQAKIDQANAKPPRPTASPSFTQFS